jgi:hypothetical protein
MEKRKIELVAKTSSLADAEAADDLFWSKTTEAYRLQTLIDLREMVFGDKKPQTIKKVVLKRNIHDEQD